MTRFLPVAALLLLTALHAAAHVPPNLASGSGALAATPVAFGPWNGTDLSFEDAVVEELAPDDLLVRRYRRDDETVWLCVISHRSRRYGAHDARICYESQGYLLDPERRIRLADSAGTEVNRFVADRRSDRRIVLYWWSADGRSTPDAVAFRNRLALGGALEGRSHGAFIRVEALVRDGDEERADRAARDFASRVAGALPAVLAADPPADAAGATP